jgi:hypothetical protein
VTSGAANTVSKVSVEFKVVQQSSAARQTLLAAVWDAVGIRISQLAAKDLPVVHDAVGVAVGGPFDKVWSLPPIASNVIHNWGSCGTLLKVGEIGTRSVATLNQTIRTEVY